MSDRSLSSAHHTRVIRRFHYSAFSSGAVATAATFACLTVLLAPSSPRAQCPTVCGDYNSSNTVTSADIFSLTAWMYQGGGNPTTPSECWDIDGYEIITNRDVVWLTRHIFDSVPDLQCDSLQPPLPMLPSLDFYFVHNTVFPAHDSIAKLGIDIVNRYSIKGASLAFQVEVDGEVAVIDTEDGGLPYTPNFIGKGQMYGFTIPAQYNGGLFGFSTPFTALPAGRHAFLDTIDVHVPAAEHDRTMKVALVNVDSIIVDSSVVRNTQVVDSNHNIWLVQVGPSDCPFALPGDTDESGTITSSDVILLVNYIFKGGSAPLPCPATDDVNCDLAVTTADLITLVNYVFKGHAMCDPCMAWLAPWGCP